MFIKKARARIRPCTKGSGSRLLLLSCKKTTAALAVNTSRDAMVACLLRESEAMPRREFEP